MKISLKGLLLTAIAGLGMVAAKQKFDHWNIERMKDLPKALPTVKVPDYAQHDYDMLSEIPAKTYYVQGKPPKWDQSVKTVAGCLVLAQEFAKQSALKNKAGACLSEKEAVIAYVNCNEDRACQLNFQMPYYHLNKK